MTVAGRLVVLWTTPRVAPGLLTLEAWDALRAADVVLAADVGDASVVALAGSGIAVSAAEVPPGRPIDLAGRLAEEAGAGAGRLVVWLASPDGDPGLGEALAAACLRLGVGLEVLVASHDLPGSRLLDLVAVMDRLRSPGGCPWDAEQTHESLLRYLVEECYEVVEAFEEGDRVAVREELGDLLLQVVFHARMAEEDPDEPFDVDDVAAGIVDKLVRRHPHVFAEGTARTPAEVETGWDALKAVEKGRNDVLAGIPAALPALARAEKVLGRLRRAGWPDDGAGASGAPLQGLGALGALRTSDDVGAALLLLVRRAGENEIDPEAALRAATRRLEEEVRRGRRTAAAE